MDGFLTPTFRYLVCVISNYNQHHTWSITRYS